MTSKEPLDTPLVVDGRDVPTYSAGHTKHEFTSWSCQTALFEFFENQYDGTADTDANSEVPTPAKKHKAEL